MATQHDEMPALEDRQGLKRWIIARSARPVLAGRSKEPRERLAGVARQLAGVGDLLGLGRIGRQVERDHVVGTDGGAVLVGQRRAIVETAHYALADGTEIAVGDDL